MEDPKSKSQVERFKKAARELRCDENEAAFEEKLRRIAKVKPKPKPDASPGKAGDDEAPE